MAELPGPPADLPEPEDENLLPKAIPGELAAMWEDKKILRRRVKEDQSCMTRWVNAKAINVASVKAMVLNSAALESLALWWCPTLLFPKAVSIDLLRAEVMKCLKSKTTNPRF